MYLSTVDYLDTSKYFTPNLLGGVMEYDVDLSEVSCGCVSAIYQTLMPAVNHTTDPFGYCDANQIENRWCPEFDVMEANRHAFHVTGHNCDAPDAEGVYPNCDRGGKCTMDILVNDDKKDYGLGAEFAIDTTYSFHVKMEYHERDGLFVGYTTTLT